MAALSSVHIDCLRICPSPSDLAINSNESIICVDCSKSFRNHGALRLHRIKTHGLVSTSADNRLLRGRNRSIKSETKLYFCPIDTCRFNNRQSINYFRTLANLKQHFGKVHEEKKLLCNNCKQAAFSLDKALRYHEKRCGIGNRLCRSSDDRSDRNGESIDKGSGKDGNSDQISEARSIDIHSTTHHLPENRSTDLRPTKERSMDSKAPKGRSIDFQPVGDGPGSGDNKSILPVIVLQPVVIFNPGQSPINYYRSGIASTINNHQSRQSLNIVSRSSGNESQISASSPIKSASASQRSLINDTQKSISANPQRILPKPVIKSTVGTQTNDSPAKKSISIQCDFSDFTWSTSLSQDRSFITPPLDLGQLATAAFAINRYPISYETAGCQTYPMPISTKQHYDTAPVQNVSVPCNDFFCQTYIPPMADASVATDFRVSTATSGQQCQLLYSNSESDLLTPPPPFDNQPIADDSNLAWTDIETQTDIAMIEFDDLFSDVAWQDMETQT